jgi:hypothetical protein
VSDESARVALREALQALTERGETVEVSPTTEGITTDRLVELAEEVRRSESRPDIKIEWIETGALVYVLGPSMG